ncbi:RNA 2',3'-cyclic phosphodiesterase [Candidatus Acetothermia bacterium]|nr:RNA 2',3'-cyclic phosphodiesterase [Candidatus Acetothermia bacterium]MBI3459618.1 RNA 2',3'-cyclic phosphodiesterase [Candidatus Acetothermia bacterium]MBI3659995.1 RNA 2',3'-cyclic phosphodiesterase [Candidatus Acetothermia bacterium]
MRAFFCVELEESFKQSLQQLTRPLRQTTADVSWVKSENFHITLKFLGEINPSLPSRLREVSEEVVTLIRPFPCTFDRTGVFPDERKPRVLWVGCSQIPQELVQLHAALDTQLEKFGFERERHFKAHITVGRVKEENKNRLEELHKIFRKITNFQFDSTATDLTLMESQLTPQGSLYKPLFRLPFLSK